MIRFKPLPGLTIVVLICISILLWLGTWQFQRLHWKRDLLIEIDAAANAAPISGLGELSDLIKAGAPIDFRRIELNGSFVKPQINHGDPFYVMRSTGKTMLWYPYRLYSADDFGIYVQDAGLKDKPPSDNFAMGPRTIAGYARVIRKPNWFIPKSKPDENSWFAINANTDVLDWADASSAVLMSVYIDWQKDGLSAAELPVKIPEISNNHLDYMLTWYSFALILLIIYLILHKRQGRLGFASKGA